MNARSLHPSAGGDGTAAQAGPGGATSALTPADPVGRACCCPANAVVRVIMPPTSARPHETELLLCGHHYRVSRRALAAARAAVRPCPGTPADTASWIGVRQCASPTPVG